MNRLGERKSEIQQSADKINQPERLWNSEYIKVMICNFLLFFAFYLLTPLLPIYLDSEFHADKDVIGLVLSGYVIATLLVRPFSGFMVDVFNRRKVLSLCFFFFFLCFTGYIGAGTLLMFTIVRTMHGIPFGATTVANSTVAIDVLPSSRRNEGIGYYGLSNNIAMAIAPSAGIWIYSATGNFALLFWISLVLSCAGFLLTTRVKIPHRQTVANKPKISLDHFFLLPAWPLAANILLFGLCWGVMQNYVAIFGQERLGITDGTGVFFALLSAGLIVSRFFGGKKLRRGEIVESGARGVLLSTVGYVLFAWSPGLWAYYLSALFIGLGNGRMYPAMLNMFVNMARHDQRGTANSSILISWDFGMGLGILAGGCLVEYISYTAAFWTVAAVQALGAIAYLAFTGRYFSARRSG